MSHTVTCIDPSQVNDADYLAAISTEARPSFLVHLKNCAYCRRELALYRALDGHLHRQFRLHLRPAKTACPEPYQIGNYFEGLLRPDKKTELERHISKCTSCVNLFEEIQNWLSQPDPLLSRKAKAELRKVVATLSGQHYSMLQGAVGLRGVTNSMGISPQIYRAEEISITLSIQPLDLQQQEFRVLGMIQREGYPVEASSGVRVSILNNGLPFISGEVDDLGHFVFSKISQDEVIDLEIVFDDRVVLVPELSLQ
ncbi:MAG TPA: hypothetical protein VH186_32970 [Chloroflexia bacterium]|nr:hypothetical protein [Chloroflexia bacterium]